MITEIVNRTVELNPGKMSQGEINGLCRIVAFETWFRDQSRLNPEITKGCTCPACQWVNHTVTLFNENFDALMTENLTVNTRLIKIGLLRGWSEEITRELNSCKNR